MLCYKQTHDTRLSMIRLFDLESSNPQTKRLKTIWYYLTRVDILGECHSDRFAETAYRFPYQHRHEHKFKQAFTKRGSDNRRQETLDKKHSAQHSWHDVFYVLQVSIPRSPTDNIGTQYYWKIFCSKSESSWQNSDGNIDTGVVYWSLWIWNKVKGGVNSKVTAPLLSSFLIPLVHSISYCMPPTIPEPIRVLRTLTAQITSLSFSYDNERLYAADIEGWVTIISTRTMRPIAMWNAHEGGVLTVEEWYIDAENGHRMITSVGF